MQRGNLIIYLGYAVGVGKTYGMLEHSKLLRDANQDVVLGYIETHQRKPLIRMTYLFNSIPLLEIEYQGVKFYEPNVIEIIKRKPQYVLIDELAHTNVPGSLNIKRHHDVHEIMDAGINVITSLNIQHVHSIATELEITWGVKLKERVVDHILYNQYVIHVNPSIKTLINRLKSGELYSEPAQIIIASQNLFDLSKLKLLRKLTTGWIKQNTHLLRA